MFYMCIFEEGATTSDSNSHYFNISSKGATNSESGTISSSTSSTKTSETTSVTIGTTLLPVSITTSTSSTPQSSATSINVSDDGDNNDSEHDGLGLGAKIGLGVGIPVAVAFGIGIGWLILGRRRKQNASTDVPAPMYEARPPVNSQYRGVPFHHQRGHSELDPEHEETFKPTEYYSNAHHPSYELPSEYPVRNMPQEMQGHEAIYQRR